MRMELERFLHYIEVEKNYSPNTIKGYQDNIEMFLDFLEQKKCSSFRRVDDRLVRAYLVELYHHQYAKKTVARHISSLRSLFKFLLQEGIIEENPMELISNPKLDKKLPTVLNYEEMEELLESPDLSTPLGVRDACMWEVLYSTGIRVSELVSLKLQDINYSLKQIKVLGKGSKERYVLFGSICERRLKEYLKVRENLNVHHSEYLFLNAQGEKLTTHGVRFIMKKYVRMGDFKGNVTPHMIRHTFATDMLNEGADLKSVQELLGHENLSTTQIYTHVTNERLRKVYLDSHPRARK